MDAHPDPNISQPLSDASAARLAERLKFLDLGNDDIERLRALAPQFHAQADQFVEKFYAHLFAFEETAQFLKDPALVERLKQSQRMHLDTMLEAVWDASYAERRFRVGAVHARVGIEPEIFLGAYNQYLQHWLAYFQTRSEADRQGDLDTIGTLISAVLLDVGLTLDAYFRESTQQIRKALHLYWNANNELRHFAQLTSHDLKTPLATVANLCDEALDEFGAEMPPEAVQLIEKARQRAFRMSETIDELLASSIKLRPDDQPQTLDSAAVLAEIVERLGPALREKRIEITLAPDLPMVFGDKARLREVFANLLSNAAKFIEHLHGRIDVSATASDGVCTFVVADNGPGIPSEEQQRIFAPFRRLSQHQHVPGSGLGLYFTHYLIEQMQGRVWVESNPGEGSRFCFTLPTTRAASARAEPAAR